MMATFFALRSTLSSFDFADSTKCAQRIILSHASAIASRSSSLIPARNASYAPARVDVIIARRPLFAILTVIVEPRDTEAARVTVGVFVI
jgi:hypothetical protein